MPTFIANARKRFGGGESESTSNANTATTKVNPQVQAYLDLQTLNAEQLVVLAIPAMLARWMRLRLKYSQQISEVEQQLAQLRAQREDSLRPLRGLNNNKHSSRSFSQPSAMATTNAVTNSSAPASPMPAQEERETPSSPLPTSEAQPVATPQVETAVATNNNEPDALEGVEEETGTVTTDASTTEETNYQPEEPTIIEPQPPSVEVETESKQPGDLGAAISSDLDLANATEATDSQTAISPVDEVEKDVDTAQAEAHPATPETLATVNENAEIAQQSDVLTTVVQEDDNQPVEVAAKPKVLSPEEAAIDVLRNTLNLNI